MGRCAGDADPLVRSAPFFRHYPGLSWRLTDMSTMHLAARSGRASTTMRRRARASARQLRTPRRATRLPRQRRRRRSRPSCKRPPTTAWRTTSTCGLSPRRSTERATLRSVDFRRLALTHLYTCIPAAAKTSSVIPCNVSHWASAAIQLFDLVSRSARLTERLVSVRSQCTRSPSTTTARLRCPLPSPTEHRKHESARQPQHPRRYQRRNPYSPSEHPEVA